MVEYTKEMITGKSMIRRFRDLYDWCSGRLDTMDTKVSASDTTAKNALSVADTAVAKAEQAVDEVGELELDLVAVETNEPKWAMKMDDVSEGLVFGKGTDKAVTTTATMTATVPETAYAANYRAVILDDPVKVFGTEVAESITDFRITVSNSGNTLTFTLEVTYDSTQIGSEGLSYKRFKALVMNMGGTNDWPALRAYLRRTPAVEGMKYPYILGAETPLLNAGETSVPYTTWTSTLPYNRTVAFAVIPKSQLGDTIAYTWTPDAIKFNNTGEATKINLRIVAFPRSDGSENAFGMVLTSDN